MKRLLLVVLVAAGLGCREAPSTAAGSLVDAESFADGSSFEGGEALDGGEPRDSTDARADDATVRDGGPDERDAQPGDAAIPIDADATTTLIHVAIQFDDLPTGTIVGSQYAAHATFSSSEGVPQTLDPYDFGQSPPNFLCALAGAYDCTGITVTFAKPVSALSFRATGVNGTGAVARVQVYGAQGLLGGVDIVGQGAQYTPVDVSLASFSDVTRIEVIDVNDLNGIGFDDFRFLFPE